MAISLADLRTVRAVKPPRMVVYGVIGVGKTTFASEFPDPVYIQTEDGTPSGLEIVSFGETDSYSGTMEALSTLYTERHDFKTLVLDSLSAFEKLVWAETCRRKGWSSIEDPGYGKGYVEADLVWQQFMEGITALRRDRDMAVVLIAHSEVRRVEDPIIGPIDRHALQLHKRAVDIINKDADVIAFMNYLVRVREVDAGYGKKHRKGEGAGERVISFADRPGFVAKNRYGLPDQITYRRGEGYAQIAEYLPGMDSAFAQKEVA